MHFIRPEFLLAFSYPDPTPDGQAVIRDEQSFRDYARVHLSSRDRRELYLEIVRFHDLTPQDGTGGTSSISSSASASARLGR